MVRRPSVEPNIAVAVKAALDKKAEDVAVLDLRGLSDVTDYFLICHGRSGRQSQSISDGIERALRDLRRRPAHIEGYLRGEWVLMDYLDFVVHIFTAERRTYYGLDRLWADAPRVPVRAPAPRAPRRSGASEGDGVRAGGTDDEGTTKASEF